MGGQIVFGIAVLAWAGLEILLHLFYNRRVREGNAEKLSKYVMLVVFAFACFGARLATPDFAAGFRAPFTPVRWVGTVLILASVVLRTASVAQLGGSYSVNLGVRAGQPLVTTGLYRLIRHPGYLAIIISFVGLGLSFAHWLATSLCLLLPPAVLAWRMGLEERMLEQAYGEEYRSWARRTRRLIPCLL
jgi:protein-S-isoprenylcysteine O-methyltransferase Ste14